ncbi:MAG: glycosyltransferase [Clostridia bacterium]|nr:glycosyltransferase [Clostridia bacterium]
MPKVSVIVPVYNTENYIEKCLNSLVNQTLEDIEIIVINDGSTDDSENLIDKFIGKYPNKIKYYKKENGGLSDARNYGLNYVTGEYIGFIDSDDYIELSMYEKMYKLAQNEQADIVECDFTWEYPDKIKIDTGIEYKDKEDLFTNSRVMACNKIFKKDIIDDIKFPKGLRYEDVEFFYKLLPNVNKIAVLKESLYYYIQRESSISNLQNERTAEIFTILNNILEFYKEKNIYDKFKIELEYMYIRFLLGSSFLRMVKIKDKKVRKDLLQKTIDLLYEKFPNWRNNKILKTAKSKKNLYYRTVNRVTFKFYSWLFSIL